MRLKYCVCVLLACLTCPVVAQKANYELAEKCVSMPLPWNYGEITPFFVPASSYLMIFFHDFNNFISFL